MLKNLFRRIKAKLSKRYRVELIDEATLSSTRQFYLKPIMVVMATFVFVMGIVIGTALMIIVIPGTHQLLPNVMTTESHDERMAAYQVQYDSLMEKNLKLELYLSTFRHLIGGDSVLLVDEQLLNSDSNGRTPLPAAWQNPVSENEDNYAENQTTPAPVEVATFVEVPTQTEKVSTPGIPVVKAFYRSVLDNLFPPLKGIVRNGYNEKLKHYGVDIVAPEKTIIHSVAPGIVIVSEYSDLNGWVMGIKSEKGRVIAFYKHNSRLLKEVGQYVQAGDPIAIIGNTGENSNGPHLHLELWHQGRPIDPEDFLTFK